MQDTYTSQTELARRQKLMEAMAGRNTSGQGIGGGLANMLRSYRGGKENRSIGDAVNANERLRSGETQSLIQSMGQGGLQGPTQSGQGQPQLQIQTPELQNFQLKQAMGQQTADQSQTRALELQKLKNVGTGGKAFSGDPILDAKNNIIGYAQPNQTGAPSYWVNGQNTPSLPEGARVVPNAAMANFMPEVLNTATPQQAATAGAIETAEQSAQTVGAGDRGAIAVDQAVDKQSRIANAEHQQELEFNINRRTAALEVSEQKQELVGEWIDSAIGEADAFSTGFFGTALEYIPGTDAFDLVATVDSIKANVGFDKLQAMRDASPTGGALGQVSEFENRLLQATLGNLDNSQSKEQFIKNLNELKYQLDQIVNNGISSFDRDYNQGQSITDRADAILGL